MPSTFLLLLVLFGSAIIPGWGFVSHGHERVVADFAVDLGEAEEAPGDPGGTIPESLIPNFHRWVGFWGSYGIGGLAGVNDGETSVGILLERFRGQARPRITLKIENLDRVQSFRGARVRVTVHRVRARDGESRTPPVPELLLDEERVVAPTMTVSLYSGNRLSRGDAAIVRLDRLGGS